MARKSLTEFERKRRKAEKLLGTLNFTPQTARYLSQILCAMAADQGIQTEARLRAFGEIARNKIGVSWK